MASSENNIRSISSQVVMICQKNLLEGSADEGNNLNVCKLRHPRTEESAFFLFSSDGQEIGELIKYQKKFSSYFVDDSVVRDGSLIIATKFNPIYILLPYLIKSSSKGVFMEMEEILEDEEFCETKRLCRIEGFDLSPVSDAKEIDGSLFYRYNRAKTMLWLQSKVIDLLLIDQIIAKLKDKKIDISRSSSHIASFVRSSKDFTAPTQDDYKLYALGLISNYIPVQLEESLLKDLNLLDSPEDVTACEENIPPPSKRAKLDNEQAMAMGDISQTQKMTPLVKKEKLTAVQKVLNKVDKQKMKSMSHFFKAVSKE